jgi:hypothetical protein
MLLFFVLYATVEMYNPLQLAVPQYEPSSTPYSPAEFHPTDY